MSNNAKNFVSAVQNQDYAGAKKEFNNAMASKINSAFENKKIELAQSMSESIIDEKKSRQLKDPDTEAMVVKNGKVEVIDKKDLDKYMKKGYEMAEETDYLNSVVNEKKNGNYYEIGGDRYDGGVVINVYVDGKKVYNDILSGEQDYKYKGKKYDNVMELLDAIAKDTSGISSGNDFERVKMK